MKNNNEKDEIKKEGEKEEEDKSEEKNSTNEEGKDDKTENKKIKRNQEFDEEYKKIERLSTIENYREVSINYTKMNYFQKRKLSTLLDLLNGKKKNVFSKLMNMYTPFKQIFAVGFSSILITSYLDFSAMRARTTMEIYKDLEEVALAKSEIYSFNYTFYDVSNEWKSFMNNSKEIIEEAEMKKVLNSLNEKELFQYWNENYEKIKPNLHKHYSCNSHPITEFWFQYLVNRENTSIVYSPKLSNVTNLSASLNHNRIQSKHFFLRASFAAKYGYLEGKAHKFIQKRAKEYLEMFEPYEAHLLKIKRSSDDFGQDLAMQKSDMDEIKEFIHSSPSFGLFAFFKNILRSINVLE
eukprot:gene4430-7805_t